MKKPHLSEDQEEWFYAFMHNRLSKLFPVVEWRDIDYGSQVRLKNGTVVNLYRTMKYNVGGHGYGQVDYLIPKMIEDFKWTLRVDKESEEFAKKVFA